MKKQHRLVGIIALGLVISCVLAGCDSKEEKEAKAAIAAEKAALAALQKALDSGDAAVFGEALKNAAPAVLATFADSHASPGGDFAYELSEELEGIIIKKYTGSSPFLVIPKEIEGYPVLMIGQIDNSRLHSATFLGVKLSDSAYSEKITDFYGEVSATKLTSLIVPEGVIAIERGAFADQDSLKNIKLADSIIFIGPNAFANCKSLTDANIPANIDQFGTYVFYNCPELYNLSIPDSLTSIPWTIGGPIWDDFVGAYGWDLNYKAGGGNYNNFEKCGKLPLATRQRLKDLGYTGTF